MKPFILLISVILCLSADTALAPKKSVGVFGAGAGGLTAAWALAYAGYNVTLYEAFTVVGGHAYSFPFRNATGQIIPVDLGAQYIAPARYPNIVEIFKLYKVPFGPWTYSFESSLAGDRWSTIPNAWQQTAFWKEMAPQAKAFEDSMNSAYLASIDISVGDWCAQLNLSTRFVAEVMTPFLLFIMQTILSPVHEVASFFVQDLYSFFNPITGWLRPGQGLGVTWTSIAASMLKRLPNNLKIITSATVTKLSLCDAKSQCSLTAVVGGKTQIFLHDYLVSGVTRTDLKRILAASTTSAVPIPSAFTSSLSETVSSIPTYLHTDSTVFDPLTPPSATMYEFYNYLFTHNYLQVSYSNKSTTFGGPLVSYKAVDGAGWAPDSTKTQVTRSWTVPVMSSSWVTAGLNFSPRFNGFGNLWFCGGMIRGDYQESAVITGLMVANALGADYPFPNALAANNIYSSWSALLQGIKLDPAQIVANNLIKGWVKNVVP